MKKVCIYSNCDLVATNYLTTSTPMCKDHFHKDRKTGIHYADTLACCGKCSCCCKCSEFFSKLTTTLISVKLAKHELVWIKNWVNFELEKLENKKKK